MGKYNLENLKNVISNPRKIRDAFRYIKWDVMKPIHNHIERHKYSYYDKEVDILNKDWDNLILLDACRPEALGEVWGEQVPHQFSVASSSPEFIEKTMNGKELYDTVYISSNPFTHKVLEKNVFYDVIQTYHRGFNPTNSGESDYTDYHPQNVFEISKEKIPTYDKRGLLYILCNRTGRTSEPKQKT